MGKPAIEIVFNRLPELRGELRTRAGQAVRKTAEDIQAQAAGTAPVDTGNLRNSIGMEVQDDLSADVVVGAEYGANVEYGLGQHPQPYLTPAAEAARPGFVAAMESLLE